MKFVNLLGGGGGGGGGGGNSPEVPTCIPPSSYERSYRGMRNRTVCFDYTNILYSLSVTTLRNLREIEACC